MEEILSMFQRIEKRMRDCTLKRTLTAGIAHSLIPACQGEVPARDKGLKGYTRRHCDTAAVGANIP
jgi:hypothetical protein